MDSFHDLRAIVGGDPSNEQLRILFCSSTVESAANRFFEGEGRVMKSMAETSHESKLHALCFRPGNETGVKVHACIYVYSAYVQNLPARLPQCSSV